jgi:YD repeat-containing protein
LLFGIAEPFPQPDVRRLADLPYLISGEIGCFVQYGRGYRRRPRLLAFFLGALLPSIAKTGASDGRHRRAAAFVAGAMAVTLGAAVTHASETKTCAYDSMGRLVGAVSADGSTTTTSIYSFDAASNRQWVNVA